MTTDLTELERIIRRDEALVAFYRQPTLEDIDHDLSDIAVRTQRQDNRIQEMFREFADLRATATDHTSRLAVLEVKLDRILIALGCKP
jgi:hypothetical protein